MMRLKGCPRCGGDLALFKSGGYTAWECVQCGRTAESEGVDAAPAASPHPENVGFTHKKHAGAP